MPVGPVFDVGRINQELYEAYFNLRPNATFALSKSYLYSNHVVPKTRAVVGAFNFAMYLSATVVDTNNSRQTGRLRSQTIPGTPHILPVGLWVAYSKNSHAELKKSLESVSEWRSIFKKNGLMGFADITDPENPKFHSVREVVEDNLYPAGVDHGSEHFTAGLWFHGDVVIPFHKTDAIQTIGFYLPTLMRHYPEIEAWVHTNPPPKTSAQDEQERWLKKIASMLIQAGWSVLSGGVIETSARTLGEFQGMAKHVKKSIRALNWPDGANVTIYLDNEPHVIAWDAVIGSQGYQLSDLEAYVEEISSSLENYCHSLSAGEAPELKALGVIPARREQVVTSEALLERIEIFEQKQVLAESMNYDQLVAATRDAWERRFETVKTVRPTPPEIVLLDDGNINLKFNYWSQPSTEGKSHKGSIEFIPDRPKKKDVLLKLASWWDDMRAKFLKFTGKKVPPKVLKASELRRMKCSVSCDCKDFLYRMEVANHEQGASPIKYSNGKQPEITNPGMNPGLCKHLLSLVLYLGDDSVNIEVAREPKKLSP